MNAVLGEEIEDLAEKLEVLQRNSGIKDKEFKKCSSNFDKQVCHLQRRLEKLGGLSDDKEFQESSSNKQNCVSDSRNQNKAIDVR